MSSRPGKPSNIATLQATRAIAALGVMLFHADSVLKAVSIPTPPGLWLGRYGVHVFFVLSGFIIYHVHRSYIGRPELGSYYLARRWVRIWPLYAALTIGQFVLKKITSAGATPTSLPEAISSLLFLDFTNDPVINVGWTLVHEAFFYLSFTIAIIGGRRWGTYFLLGFTALLLTATYFPDGNGFYQWVFSPAKYYFIVGVIAAGVYHRIETGSFEPGERTLYLSVMILCLLSAWIPAREAHFLYPGPIACGIATVIVLLVCAERRFAGFRIPAFLLLIGDASYSIYLTHSSILFAASLAIPRVLGHLQAPWNYVVAVVTFLATLAAGLCCYFFLEKPLIRYFSRFVKKPASA